MHRFAWVLVLCVALAGIVVAEEAPARATSADRVLVLADTVTGGASSIEASQAATNGMAVDVVDGVTWASMTAEQFAGYRALILGDATCTSLNGDTDAATSNAMTWGSVVNGNVLINGTDPVYHASEGGEALTRQSVDFAVGQVGRTGLYLSLSCYYHDTAPMTPVPLLDGIGGGGFSVSGVGCYNNAHFVAESVAFTGLTDATISGWDCSVHEAFSAWPETMTPVAIARDFDASYEASDGSNGPPYILASGDVTAVQVGPGSDGYVALGDSYSAGEGYPKFDTTPYDTAADGCHRSPRAYPKVRAYDPTLRKSAPIVLPTVTARTYRACSGAIVASFTRGERNGSPAEPRQLDVLGSSTDYVTLTIGGNDAPMEFAEALKSCARIEIGQQIITQKLQWLNGWKIDDADCSSRLDAVSGTGPIASLRTSLADLYRRVLRRVGPDTKVRVATYPKLFPDASFVGVSGVNGSHQCQVAHFRWPITIGSQHVQITFSPEDLLRFNAAQVRLNETIAAAMGDVNDGRLRMADLYSRMSGHPVDCGPGDKYKPWVNGVRVSGGNGIGTLGNCLVSTGSTYSVDPSCSQIIGSWLSGATFHPNPTGLIEMARGVNDSLK